jgi:hypothetical protein
LHLRRPAQAGRRFAAPNSISGYRQYRTAAHGGLLAQSDVVILVATVILLTDQRRRFWTSADPL